jgi:chromosome segregation ATPase
MSIIIAQETPLGRKARRQRFAFRKIDELSAENATLRSQLCATEEALSESESKAREIHENLVRQLGVLQSRVAELEQSLMIRNLESERFERAISFLKDELDEVCADRERLRLDNNQLAAENKCIKINRARYEIEAWRAISHKTPWKRCYAAIEGFFRKESDDNRQHGFENLLRLPPP